MFDDAIGLRVEPVQERAGYVLRGKSSLRRTGLAKNLGFKGAMAMSSMTSEWDKEQSRLNTVLSEIERQQEELEREVGSVTTDIVEIRRNFWDDVTINFDDIADTLETYASIKQQSDILSEHERRHRWLVAKLRALRRLRESAYFGRIDFQEQGESEPESIYIGVSSLRDQGGDDFLIYDWRAPIASLYYDYPPGPAQYETPGGTIHGQLHKKRQFVIRGERLEGMFDTDTTIGDDILQEVLGRRSDAQMHNIVATIQREQNQAIRDEESRLLMVQGVAGSGKTSVAMQRVAYLLYRYRRQVRSDQILLFSPNAMFNAYVRTVLPELGEEAMLQTTYHEYVEHRLGGRFRVESPFAQLEFLYSGPAQERRLRLASIHIKSQRAFLQHMDAYIDALARQGMVFRDIRFRGQVLLSAADVEARFAATDATWKLPLRLRQLARSLVAEARELAEKQRGEAWVDEELELLSEEDYQKAHRQAQRESRRKVRFDDFQRVEQILRDMVIHRHLRKTLARIRRLGFVDTLAIYRRLYDPEHPPAFLPAAEGDAWREVCQATLGALADKRMWHEDATPYLYLRDRLFGFPTNTSIRFVFIDEVQDYSPFQLAYLQRLFPHARVTALGDVHQSIFPHSHGANVWAELAQLYAEPGPVRKLEMWRSYRSTRPIAEFAKSLLPDGDKVQPFAREGRLPVLTVVANERQLVERLVRCIEDLRAAGHRTIAVLCKTAKEAALLYTDLAPRTAVQRIDERTHRFEPGVHVLPVYLAKGIEFDAVMVHLGPEADNSDEMERGLLYTACTRAMHELHVFCLGEPSPLLARVPASLYERID
ncbi:MAG: UvrD-helicase domain-containing protein [Alicyclobacillus herbarius]|uniref:RNA polymerase recycling motor HelD n=1 Tax=Alicyclobacillus herbarius TaxID=122960 RepID=UPI0023555313|nr:RNA polymerase recycling motor HelD [Alicyclobacillus herbarius]MCL6631735.1 UvrD-helicase domain-containing protein [Alicyclobacillus herbarius]